MWEHVLRVKMFRTKGFDSPVRFHILEYVFWFFYGREKAIKPKSKSKIHLVA